jgi:large subunit ribosomal protein L15
MKLGTIAPPKGGTKKRKRLGIGPGSGTGKTAGKGHKGQKARSGAKHRAWFEGGQMPLHQRLPKVGFNNPFGTVYQVVNLSDLSRKELSGEITPAVLKAAGLISSANRPVKILGQGDVSTALQVKVQAVSASAAEKIVKAGGSVENYPGGDSAQNA